jgi:hypothetical protein
MKQTYITPAMQETPMDLRSAIADLTGNAGDDHIGWGGQDDGSHDAGSNSRNSWDQFWDDRE